MVHNKINVRKQTETMTLSKRDFPVVDMSTIPLCKIHAIHVNNFYHSCTCAMWENDFRSAASSLAILDLKVPKNKADLVLSLFQNGVEQWGPPPHVSGLVLNFIVY